VQALLKLRREHAALRGGWLWHLASDESSYVFARESEEERLAVAFNNAESATGASHSTGRHASAKSVGHRPSLRRCQGRVGGEEIHITMPGQSALDFFTELAQGWRQHGLEREANAPILRGVRHDQRDGMSAVVVPPFADNVITDANFFGCACHAEHCNLRAPPHC